MSILDHIMLIATLDLMSSPLFDSPHLHPDQTHVHVFEWAVKGLYHPIAHTWIQPAFPCSHITPQR